MVVIETVLVLVIVVEIVVVLVKKDIISGQSFLLLHLYIIAFNHKNEQSNAKLNLILRITGEIFLVFVIATVTVRAIVYCSIMKTT
jgi:hypothetical protein